MNSLGNRPLISPVACLVQSQCALICLYSVVPVFPTAAIESDSCLPVSSPYIGAAFISDTLFFLFFRADPYRLKSTSTVGLRNVFDLHVVVGSSFP
jgi:hypothetical protein